MFDALSLIMDTISLLKNFDKQCIQETMDAFSLKTGTTSMLIDPYGQILISSTLIRESDFRIQQYIRWNTRLVGTKAELMNEIWMGKAPIKIGKDKIGDWVIAQADGPALANNGVAGFYFLNAMQMLPIIANMVEYQIVDRIQLSETKKNLDEKEKELITERIYLKALMDNLPSHIYFKDKQSRYIRNSRSRVEFFNYDNSDELVGKTDFDFFNEINARKSMADEKIVIENGVTVCKEEQCVQKDGSYVWFSTIKSPLIDNYGNVIGSFGISNDITDVVIARFRLEQNEIRFRTIVENLGEGVGIIDKDYKFEFCNKAAESFIGVGKDGLEDRSIFDFMDVDQQSKLYKNYSDWGKRDLNTVEVTINSVDGKKLNMLVTSAPRLNELGLPDGAYCVFRDISDIRRAEEIIKQQNEQLQTLNSQKDQLLSIIAHDLRTPFSSLLGLTDVLNRELPKMPVADAQTLAWSIRNSAVRMFDLLSNLLEWSHLNRGGVNVVLQPFLLNDVVSQCAETAGEMAHEKSIVIENKINPALEVKADPYLLQIVVNNLLTNALKFTNRNGCVRILSTPYEENFIKISVSDNGIGIPEEMRKNLFEKGLKNNRFGTDGEPSTGLGLILCKEFVERNGGKLWVDSEEGKGSTFSFTLKLLKQ